MIWHSNAKNEPKTNYNDTYERDNNVAEKTRFFLQGNTILPCSLDKQPRRHHTSNRGREEWGCLSLSYMANRHYVGKRRKHRRTDPMDGGVEKNSSSATAVYAQHWYSEGVR